MCAPALRVLGATALLVGFCSLFSSLPHAEENPAHPAAVRIGMISTLFSDVPEAAVMAMMQPFAALMEAQTGVSGELVPCGDAFHLGQQLADDRVQLGVFHGIEFGWARQKHPNLRPLMIAINQQRYLRAHLIVRADRSLKELRELQDQALALPHESREHCQLFLRRCCLGCQKEPAAFFRTITSPANAEDALDDVVDKVVQASIVDSLAYDCYKRRKPGRFAKLQIAQTSEIFPAAVVAFRPGTLDESILKRFREGMIHANRSVLGRQLMTLWKLTGFEEVPPDYDQVLLNIVKAYPPPNSGK